MFHRSVVRSSFSLLLLILLLLFACTGPAFAAREFPDALRFTQRLTRKRYPDGRMLSVILPNTASTRVDQEIAKLVESMGKKGYPYLKPSARASLNNRGDFGSYITRVGDRWMSFLTVGRVTENSALVWLSADARVYNMETGRRVWLKDILDEASGAWEKLAAEARSQLSAFFPGESADPAALDALCTREALSSAGFTLSPGHLSLIWPAEVLYPDHAPGLLRVEIYVPILYDLLTDEAREEMNCDGYALVALTYDDGPAMGTTDLLLDQLQIAGAPATFFLIGRNIEKNQAVVRRQYDAGFSVQSHTWSHAISRLNSTRKGIQFIREQKVLYDDYIGKLIGVLPVMMRAPGGIEKPFQAAEIPLPCIHWSVISGDADSSNQDIDDNVIDRASRAQDGDIVLLHDVYHLSSHAAQIYLQQLEKRSVLLVTVNDLCALRGIPLDPGTVICSARPE